MDKKVKEMARILGNGIFFYIGLIVVAGLLMPILSYLVTSDGDRWYREMVPFRSSIFQGISAIYLLLIMIYLFTKK